MLGSPIFSMPSLSSCTSTRPSLFLSRRSNSSTNRFSSPLGGPEGGLSPPLVTVPCIGHCSLKCMASTSPKVKVHDILLRSDSIVLGHPEGRLVIIWAEAWKRQCVQWVNFPPPPNQPFIPQLTSSFTTQITKLIM